MNMLKNSRIGGLKVQESFNDECYLHVQEGDGGKGMWGLMGIDVNEKSIDLAVVKPDKVRFRCK